MEKQVFHFIQVLRNRGIRISSSEVIDTFQTIQLIGIENKDNFKNALATVLAKSQEAKHQFNICFEHFFSKTFDHHQQTPYIKSKEVKIDLPISSRDGEANRLLTEDGEAEDREIEDNLEMSNHTEPRPLKTSQCQSHLGRKLMSGDYIGLQSALRRIAKSIDLGKIDSPLRRALYIQRIMEAMGNEALEVERQEYAKQGEKGNFQAYEFAKVIQKLQEMLWEEVRAMVEKKILQIHYHDQSHSFDNLLMTTKLTALEKWYYKDIYRLVKKMARNLTALHSRRKKFNQNGHLDMQKTFRANAKYGGIIFEPKWKLIKVESPKVYAFCDVSRSVGMISRFFLMFLYSMQEVLPHLHTYAFSHFLEETTPQFKRYSLEEAITQTLKLHGAGLTDYGQCFKAIREQCLNAIDHRTILIILGDGRNNEKESQSDILKLFFHRAKQVIWLNPEEKYRWGTGDSAMPHYLPFCHKAEVCNSLNHLSHLFNGVLTVVQK